MDYLEENLEQFALRWPLEAVWLQQYEPVPIPYNPIGDDIHGVELLYVYGVAHGVYTSLLPWLKAEEKRRLVVLEDDPERLLGFFCTKEAKEAFGDNRLSIAWLRGDKEEQEALLGKLSWYHVHQTPVVIAIEEYVAKKESQLVTLRQQIVYKATINNSSVQEFIHGGAIFFRNFYPNMGQLEKSLWANPLFGKFKGIPAIICGAGPSLAKQIPLLEKLKNRALIFAGGSSLNGLMAAGFLPHFGAGIDPNPAQLERLKKSQAPIPFFYRNRLYHPALMEVKGPHLYVSGTAAYDVAGWYEKEIGIHTEPINEGCNVVHMCCDIARRMGCSPLIFVGMDLAYTAERHYSPGIEEISMEAIRQREPEGAPIVRADIYGHPTWSCWRWIAEADWISAFAKHHAKMGIYNATEGGIGMPGIENIPLEEVVQKWLQKNYRLDSRLKRIFSTAHLPKGTGAKVRKLHAQMEKSLVRCQELLQVISTHITEGGIVGLGVAAEIEMTQEIAYQAILEGFQLLVLQLQSQRLAALRLGFSALEEKMVLQRERVAFLNRVIDVNLLILRTPTPKLFAQDI